MVEDYKLEKGIWTQDDFDVMGWHDSNIYGFAIEKAGQFTGDLVFDIDYIFQWVDPVAPAKNFSFWVSPCTLVFKDSFDLVMNIETGSYALEWLEIADIELLSTKGDSANKQQFEWRIDLQLGEILVSSYGYEQIVRKEPKHINSQVLDLEDRGGICFERNPCV